MDPSGPACPRCAYDLSGSVASWTDACPLTGRCPECGLPFAWQEILDPDVAGPAWSFEHGHGPIPARLRRFFATLAHGLAPARAWRDLHLSTTVHPWRLALFVALTLALMHLADSLVIILSRAVTPVLSSVLAYQWRGLLLWPYGEGRFFSPLDGMPFGTPLLIITATLTLAMPLTLLLLGETFRRHSIRASHLLRGVCYSIPVAAAWIVATTVLKHILKHGPLRSFLESMARHPAAMPILAGVYALVLGLWWRGFIARYLRVAGATAITTVMMGVAYLGTMTTLIAIAVMWRLV